jgi:hypothetical protein
MTTPKTSRQLALITLFMIRRHLRHGCAATGLKTKSSSLIMIAQKCLVSRPDTSERSRLTPTSKIHKTAEHRVRMPVSGHLPQTIDSPLQHHLRYTSRLGKIILGHQQITLLRDAWRVAQPGTDYVQWELALQFRLSAGPHRVEQSWPTRNASAAQ